MALTNKLAAIANAIRGKTGSSEAMTLDQMATAINGIETGGSSGGSGGSAFYSGSFTPTENVLSIEIDVGGSFTMLLLHTQDTVTGNGVKAARGILFDPYDDYINILTTNNTGTAVSSVYQTLSGNGSGGAVGGNGNLLITRNGNIFSVKSTLTSGNCPGYFIGGVTYKWYAW